MAPTHEHADHDDQDTMPRHASDHDDELPFEPPPFPMGLSPDVRYLAELHVWSTRELLRDGRRTRRAGRTSTEERAPPSAGAWASLMATVAKLPVGVQAGLFSTVGTAVAGAITYIALNLGGALFEKWTGHAPPMPTSPVSFETTNAHAADVSGTEPHH